MRIIFITTAVLFMSGIHAADLKIVVRGAFPDTLTAYITIDDATNQSAKVLLQGKQGIFHLHYDLEASVLLTIRDKKNVIRGIMEKEDDVLIQYNADSLLASFTSYGKGASRYWAFDRNLISRRISLLTTNAAVSTIDSCFLKLRALETFLLDSIGQLGFKRAASRSIARGYYKREFNYARRRVLAKLFPDIPCTLLSRNKQLSSYMQEEARLLFTFDDDLYNSSDYTNDVYYCLLQDYMLLTLKKMRPGDSKDKYQFYLQYLPAEKLRERVLCLLLETDFKQLNDTDYLIELARKEYGGKNTIYATYVDNLVKAYGSLFRKGEKAPNFLLTDTAGRNITLADLRGKVVIMDFWYENCVPCISLFSSLTPLKEQLSHRKDLVFLNVSIDSKDRWLSAIQRLQLKGYNVYTQDLKDTHSIISNYRVNGYPALCILDKNGNFFNASPPVGNMPALLSQIEKALKTDK